jgi:enamine deaminase RidA (YjgF/YER057c/UK114 family)
MAERRRIDAPDAPRSQGGYAQAVEIREAERILHVSGQIPVHRDGHVPESFTDQCRLVWANVAAQLHAADMDLADIVKVTTYLSDRKWAEENSAVRRSVLGDLAPALTVVIAGIFDERWLLEIEVVAAA